MLVHRKGCTSNSLTTVLDEGKLYCDCQRDNEDEHPIVEEVGEHIIVMFVDFATVDLVKDLHKDKRVEDHCVVIAIVNGPGLIRSPELNSEQERATK